MSKLVRFGVSLDEELLISFDKHCKKKRYNNRSEAIRDLIRKALVEDNWEKVEGEVAGTLTIVYDHHKHDLSRKLVQIQHDDHDLIITTMHVHLDHDNCLEVLILKGEVKRVQKLADRLISCRGVKHGVFNNSTTGKRLA